jgi:hypothetical protein
MKRQRPETSFIHMLTHGHQTITVCVLFVDVSCKYHHYEVQPYCCSLLRQLSVPIAVYKVDIGDSLWINTLETRHASTFVLPALES